LLRAFAVPLGLKVAAVLGLIMALTAATLIGVSADFAESLGEQAADRGAEALRGQAYDALQRITAEQARRYGAQFRRTRTLSRLLAERTEDLLSSPAANGAPPAAEGLQLVRRKGMLTNGPEAPASLVHFAGPRASPAARQAMARTAPLDPLLARARREAFSATAAWLTSEHGFVRYAPNRPLIKELPGGDEFDVRNGHFYRAAAPDRNPQGQTVWTRVYQDPAGQGLMVTVATPVYGADATFRGVTGIDVTLADMVDRILAAQPLPGAGDAADRDGQFSFLTDRRGRVIAFPRDRLADFGIAAPAEPTPGRVLDISLATAAKAEVRAALHRARKHNSSAIARVTLDGAPHLLALHTVPGTDWLLGNVVAERAVLAGVQPARAGIDREVTELTGSLTALSLGLLVLALLAVSAYLAWALVRPLRRLAHAADRVRAGGYGVHVPADRADELGQTGQAFNDMSDRLAGLVGDLEARVAERTQEAEAARHHIQSILENSPVGIVFLDGARRMQRINPAFRELFPYPEEELLGRTTALLYASEAEFARVGGAAYPILRDGGTYATTTRLQRADGTPFPASLRGRALDPNDLSQGFIWAVQDITEQKHLEDELRLLATTFRTSQASFITDRDGHIERVNPAFTAITGYRPGEVIGRNPRMFKSGYQDADFYRDMWWRILEEGHWEGEIWNRRKDGSLYPLYESVSVVRNDRGEVERFVAVFHDISEQKRLEAELDFQASHDRLTGLYNRKHFEDLLEQERHRADRYGGTFSLIMFDIDHFKRVNDRFGHHTGDDLLVRIPRLVDDHLRDSDNLARWGGEEFMLLLPQTEAHEAQPLAERLRRQVAEAGWADLPAVTLSLGVAQYRPGESADDLTRRVDDALYRAKNQGRNRVATA